MTALVVTVVMTVVVTIVVTVVVTDAAAGVSHRVVVEVEAAVRILTQFFSRFFPQGLHLTVLSVEIRTHFNAWWLPAGLDLQQWRRVRVEVELRRKGLSAVAAELRVRSRGGRQRGAIRRLHSDSG